MLTSSFLAIEIGNELYGLSTNDFEEIRGFGRIMKTSGGPNNLIGFTEIRFFKVPILDLKAKLGKSKTEITKTSCLILMEKEMNDNRRYILSMLTDSFPEMIDLDKNSILPLPSQIRTPDKKHIRAIANYEETPIYILDVDYLISFEELLLIMSSYDDENDIPMNMFRRNVKIPA
jgi:purine-binding chemotaxis protein CheW